MTINVVHVSDIHFAASFLPGRGNPAGRATIRPIHGLESHDPIVCEYLRHRLVRLEPKWRGSVKLLAVTGDLTVKGHDGEFSQALTFLSGEISTSFTARVGLGPFQFKEMLAIPGNHDHWGGGWLTQWFLRGVQHRIHGNFFPGAAGQGWWAREYPDPSGHFTLQLLGLDSSAGGQLNLLAKGQLNGQDVTALKQQLADWDARQGAPQNVARLLMVHHGSNMPGLIWNKATHSLDKSSLDHIDDLRKAGVQRVLTGHIHSPHRSDFELRSGTTLQESKKGGQSFFTHELTWRNPGIGLTTRLYQRRASGGFTLVSKDSSLL